MPRVTVIIPNYNGHRWLKICLDSLKRQTFTEFEVLVVDNGSSDGSVQFIKDSFPEVRVLALPENRGFVGAVNEGIRNSQSEYVALLNNDIEAHPRWLEELMKFLDAHKEVGFCASKMLNYYDRQRLDDCGDGFTIWGIGYKIGERQLDSGLYNEVREVFGACGGAALYRRSLFEDVGLFDESFWMYYEDVDLSFRARWAGHKCLYVPTAIVYHMVGMTARKEKVRLRRWCIRNGLTVLAKNLPGCLVPSVLVRIPALEIHWLFRCIWEGSPLAFLLGHLDFFRRLPAILRQRRVIQKNRKVNARELAMIIDRKLPFSGKQLIKKVFGDKQLMRLF